MFERIKHIVLKEFIQIFRNPRMKMVIFLMPVIQIMLFGYAVTTDVRNVPLGVYDLDNSFESRRLIREFTSSGYFAVKRHILAENEEQELLDKSLVSAVIRMDRGFESDIKARRPALAQLILDGTDSNTASVTLSYAKEIVRNYSASLAPGKNTGGGPGVELRLRTWFNENLESRNFYVPGVIALIVSLITLLLTSMAMVREKEIGTMEQLMVSPIKAEELIIGKLIPFAVIGIVDALIISAVGILVFHVPMRGDIFFLLLAMGLYLLTTLGMGLFISTLAKTQQEAMMSTFMFYFPAILLSGFVFPIRNMPEIIQYVTYLNPLRYFMVILRGVFLKGSGISVLWPQMLILLIMGITVLTLSSLRFHKEQG